MLVNQFAGFYTYFFDFSPVESRTMKQRQWTFVVGGFGFLGQYIVWGLIRRGYQVAIGTSKRTDITVQQRLRNFTTFNRLANPKFSLNYEEFEKIKIIECDVSKHNLSLSSEGELWLRENRIIQIWNCAAHIKYGEDAYHKCYEVNVEGTSNLVRLALEQAECNYYHVSTAYVGGKDYCKGRLLKEELCLSETGYFNSYDITKAHAEQKVVSLFNSRNNRFYTIFRPTIIIGDSVTGFTSSTTGFYEYLQALTRLKGHLAGNEVRLIFDPTSLLHLIPVDRCAEAVLSLAPVVSYKETPIYTIADTYPMTLGEVANLLSPIFNCKIVSILAQPEDEEDHEKRLRLFTKRNQIFSQHSFRFSNERTCSLIDESICSDWEKTSNYFRLLNHRLGEVIQF
jgi:nucleoside-diphosphate-sugar epimerase